MPSSSSSLMLDGCKCIVTGASSGIGRATCRILTNYGATVVGVGRNVAELERLQREDKAIVGYIEMDLASKRKTTSGNRISDDGNDDGLSPCEQAVHDAVQILGGTLTTVVNAAGALRGGAVGSPGTNLQNYEFNMKINVQVPFEITTAAVPFLKKTEASAAAKEESSESSLSSKTAQSSPEASSTDNYNSTSNNKDVICPSIVNVSSVNGLQSFPGCATYCMSKAALDQLTRCASVDLAQYGIRVNSVNPGVVKTNLHRSAGLDEESYQSFLDRSINVTHPLSTSLGRVGDPDEIGELIAFLVSNKAKFMTGECIAIDGGRQNLGAR